MYSTSFGPEIGITSVGPSSPTLSHIRREGAGSGIIEPEEQARRDREAIKNFYTTTHTGSYQGFHPAVAEAARGKSIYDYPELRARKRTEKEQKIHDKFEAEHQKTMERAREFESLALSGKLMHRPLGMNIYPKDHGGSANVYGSDLNLGGVGAGSNNWKSAARESHPVTVFSKAHNKRFGQPVGLVPIGKFIHQSQPGVAYRSSGPLAGVADPTMALKKLKEAGYTGCDH
jgi:hypothetical protein